MYGNRATLAVARIILLLLSPYHIFLTLLYFFLCLMQPLHRQHRLVVSTVARFVRQTETTVFSPP